MIKTELVGGDALVALLRSWNPKLQNEIEASIGRSVLRLQRHIKANKLSGQVLNVQTGTLRRSIDQVIERRSNGVVGIVNTNLRYGAAHEYGFSGVVNVRSHLRQIKQAFGRPLNSVKSVYVRPSVRSVRLPERSFLRSALRDLQPSISADLQAAIGRAIK